MTACAKAPAPAPRTAAPEAGADGTVRFEDAEGDPHALTRDEVDRIIKSRKLDYLACYQRALDLEPELAGKVVIELAIDDDGKVTRAEVLADRSTLDSVEVHACLNLWMMGLKFPAKGGAIVKYPFIFSAS